MLNCIWLGGPNSGSSREYVITFLLQLLQGPLWLGVLVCATVACMTQIDLFDWFGLVSLFNGISTFVGYLMPKLFT